MKLTLAALIAALCLTPAIAQADLVKGTKSYQMKTTSKDAATPEADAAAAEKKDPAAVEPAAGAAAQKDYEQPSRAQPRIKLPRKD